MDFVNSLKETIEEGDLVIFYDNPQSVAHAYMKDGEYYETRFGRYNHNTIIGQKWGSKVMKPNIWHFNAYMYLNI